VRERRGERKIQGSYQRRKNLERAGGESRNASIGASMLRSWKRIRRTEGIEQNIFEVALNQEKRKNGTGIEGTREKWFDADFWSG